MTIEDKVYFVSGGSRGIGFQLVSQISSRPKTKVIATATNPEKSLELQKLAKERGNIHILKYEASSQDDAIAVGKQLGEIVDGVDVFIPNAAIAKASAPVLETSAESFRNHYDVNVLGTILLFQALYPYLIKRDTRKILFISSLAGSIGSFFPISVSAYGQSKAALNYTVKEISFELSKDNFIVAAIHPGGVDTDMARPAMEKFEKLLDPAVFEQLKASVITPVESASKVLEVLDNLKAEDNGSFLNYTGENLTW